MFYQFILGLLLGAMSMYLIMLYRFSQFLLSADGEEKVKALLAKWLNRL